MLNLAKYGFVLGRAPQVEDVDWSSFGNKRMVAELAKVCGDVLSSMLEEKIVCKADYDGGRRILMVVSGNNALGLELSFEGTVGKDEAVEARCHCGLDGFYYTDRVVEVKELSKSGYHDAVVFVINKQVENFRHWAEVAEKRLKAIRSVERSS